MKKSTLLSFATAAAIVVTSAGTYAAWDTMKTSNTTTLTVRKTVKQVITASNFSTSNTTNNSTLTAAIPSYTGSGTVTVSNVPNDAKTKYEVEIVPTLVEVGTANPIDTSVATVAISDLTSPADSAINGEYAYNVNVTPVDGDTDKDRNWDVIVTSTIKEKTTQNP